MRTCGHCQNSNVRDNETHCAQCGRLVDGALSLGDPPSTEKYFLSGIGGTILAIGLIGCLYYLFVFDISVSSETSMIVNSGLVSDRATGVTFMGALMVAGACLLASGRRG